MQFYQSLKGVTDWREACKRVYPDSLHEIPIQAKLDGNTMDLPEYKAIMRTNGKTLGIVKESYHLEQPSEVMDLEAYMASGLIDLEAGGAFKGGRKMWLQAKVRGSEQEIVKNDVVKAYFLRSTAFDGSGSRLDKFCNGRVVCRNTLAAAIAEDTAEWRTRHTRNMDERIEEVKLHVHKALVSFTESVEAYKALAAKKVSTTTMRTYVRNVMATDIKEQDYTPQLTVKVNLVLDLLDSQRGLESVPAARGTAWQAYNAVTEYITHHAGRSDENRLHNQWFDNVTVKANQRAMAMALTM